MLTDPKTCDISIIIPALNEERHLAATLEAAQAATNIEILVVDGGSRDNTIGLARKHGVPVLASPPGRARQMNTGAWSAQGKILVFLHADTILPAAFADEVARILSQPGVAAGAFRLIIAAPGKALRFIERCANLRASLWQLPYGDQALFLTAERFRALGGFPDIPFLEDLVLVRRLRRLGRIAIAGQAVRTSGRRWQEKGVWRTTLANQLILLGSFFGVSPDRLDRWRRQGKQR